jgi:hypothetical protein
MNNFVDAIAAELERPRPLPKQVSEHVSSHHSVSRDEVGPFLENEMEKLEDFEVDLVLSPIFTPGLSEQAVFSDLIDQGPLPADEWPELVRRLAARPVVAKFVTEDGMTHLVKLREVAIERYVTRLNLDVRLPEALGRMLNTLAPAEDRSWLKALARRAVWKEDARRDILFRYLLSSTSDNFYQKDDLAALLKYAESYRPGNAAEVVGRIPHWQEVIRKEIVSAANPKPFFADRVQELHGGGRDQRHQNLGYIHGKQAELAFLDRLQSVLTS